MYDINSSRIAAAATVRGGFREKKTRRTKRQGGEGGGVPAEMMADREGSSKVEKMKKQYRPRQVNRAHLLHIRRVRQPRQ